MHPASCVAFVDPGSCSRPQLQRRGTMESCSMCATSSTARPADIAALVPMERSTRLAGRQLAKSSSAVHRPAPSHGSEPDRFTGVRDHRGCTGSETRTCPGVNRRLTLRCRQGVHAFLRSGNVRSAPQHRSFAGSSSRPSHRANSTSADASEICAFRRFHSHRLPFTRH